MKIKRDDVLHRCIMYVEVKPILLWKLSCENVTHTLSGHFRVVGFHHIPKVLYWPEFGNCEGCSSTVNSLPHSRNQYDLILALWRCSIEVAFRRLVHCGHKGMDTVGNNTQGGCVPWTPHRHQSGSTLFHTKFRCYNPSVAAEIQTHQTRQHFSNVFAIFCSPLISLCKL